ncbi:hypothetical protein OG279_26180 [Streptomyces sp. NBC_01201]|uniref:hypothetical protein n=1 Tax=unclassified Streptomyces TaxID=2593676 RepID=UPI002E16625E|nr:hypothetical protein OG725_24430 [Streptomyces sp. NBC_01213]WSQ82775.1 hypothetical protein OG725_37375 [Streptomyces sp. NBC_01213]WSR50908.1 hypothetical protein OG279_26180 [Streptomyces sp. NBC_01201]
MSIDFDIELQHFLAEPSRAQQILTATASALRSEDPLQPLTLDVLNDYVYGATLVLTEGLPDVVADEVKQAAARVLPSIHPGETADAYALRLLQAARGL